MKETIYWGNKRGKKAKRVSGIRKYIRMAKMYKYHKQAKESVIRKYKNILDGNNQNGI